MHLTFFLWFSSSFFFFNLTLQVVTVICWNERGVFLNKYFEVSFVRVYFKIQGCPPTGKSVISRKFLTQGRCEKSFKECINVQVLVMHYGKARVGLGLWPIIRIWAQMTILPGFKKSKHIFCLAFISLPNIVTG